MKLTKKQWIIGVSVTVLFLMLILTGVVFQKYFPESDLNTPVWENKVTNKEFDVVSIEKKQSDTEKDDIEDTTIHYLNNNKASSLTIRKRLTYSIGATKHLELINPSDSSVEKLDSKGMKFSQDVPLSKDNIKMTIKVENDTIEDISLFNQK